MKPWRRKASPKKKGATSKAYTSEWYPGAPLEKRLAWRHEPDRHELWASMDYDERWTLTVILEPWRLMPHSMGGQPLHWEELLEKWRSYRKRAV
jgi:hypothetical protein